MDAKNVYLVGWCGSVRSDLHKWRRGRTNERTVIIPSWGKLAGLGAADCGLRAAGTAALRCAALRALTMLILGLCGLCSGAV